jgi:hypothetical protein
MIFKIFCALFIIFTSNVSASPATPAEMSSLEGKWQVCSLASKYRNNYNCLRFDDVGDVFKFFPKDMTVLPLLYKSYDNPVAKSCWVDMRGTVLSVENQGETMVDMVHGTLFVIRFTSQKRFLLPSRFNHGPCAEAVKNSNAAGPITDELRVIFNSSLNRLYWDVSPGKTTPKILRKLEN